MKEFIIKLKKLNKKALKRQEIPVSAVIVKSGKIISKATNNRNEKNEVLGHAEIIAIKKASRKLKTWKLDDCIMYVTLEPCAMCKEIIKQSRIKEVNYFLGNKKEVNYKTKFSLLENESQNYFENELKLFFKNIR